MEINIDPIGEKRLAAAIIHQACEDVTHLQNKKETRSLVLFFQPNGTMERLIQSTHLNVSPCQIRNRYARLLKLHQQRL